MNDILQNLKANDLVKRSHFSKGFKYNPLDPQLRVDPYPTYHYLRSEDPVHEGKGIHGKWFLSRYIDAKNVLTSSNYRSLQNIPVKAQQFKVQGINIDFVNQSFSKFLMLMEPPEHTRLRRIVSKAFTTVAIRKITSEIQEIVNGHLEKVRSQGTMDIIADLAEPLPVILISKIIGIPDNLIPQFHNWSKITARMFDPVLPIKYYIKLDQVLREWSECIIALSKEKARYPQADLLSSLVSVVGQEDKLTEDELPVIVHLLFATGEETTVNLIGNGMHALLRHPNQMMKLKKNPEIINDAVEELLRYDCPVQYLIRGAINDVEIGGKLIRAGEPIVLLLGAANRDPEQFVDPEQLDLTRGENLNLAFGDGIHRCLGVHLAKAQAQIAINTMVQELPNLKISTDNLRWSKNILIRGLESLPVTFNY